MQPNTPVTPKVTTLPHASPVSPPNAVEKLIDALKTKVEKEYNEVSPGSPGDRSWKQRVDAMKAKLTEEYDEVYQKVLAAAKWVDEIEDWAEAEAKEEWAEFKDHVNDMVSWVLAQHDKLHAAVVALAQRIADAEDHTEAEVKRHIKALAAWLMFVGRCAKKGVVKFYNRLADAAQEEYDEFVAHLQHVHDEAHRVRDWVAAEVADEVQEVKDAAEKLVEAVKKVEDHIEAHGRQVKNAILDKLAEVEYRIHLFHLVWHVHHNVASPVHGAATALAPATAPVSPPVDVVAILEQLKQDYVRLCNWFTETVEALKTPPTPAPPKPVFHTLVLPTGVKKMPEVFTAPSGQLSVSYSQRFWRMARCYGRAPITCYVPSVATTSAPKPTYETYISSGPSGLYNWMKFGEGASSFSSPCLYDDFTVSIVSTKPMLGKASTEMPTYASVSLPFRVVHSWSCNPVIVSIREFEDPEDDAILTFNKNDLSVDVTFTDGATYNVSVYLMTGVEEFCAQKRREACENRKRQLDALQKDLLDALHMPESPESPESHVANDVGRPNQYIVVKVNFIGSFPAK